MLLVIESVQKVVDLKNSNNWCVLSICLLTDFHWHSRCPKEMCAVMSHKWCVGYAFKTGWKSTNSVFSSGWGVYKGNHVQDAVIKMSANYLQCCMYKRCYPKFHWRFKYYILHIARSYFSCGLVFNMQKMSVVLNLDNSVSGSPLEIPFSGLLLLEIYSVTYLKRGWCPVHGLLCSFEVILIQHLLGNG